MNPLPTVSVIVATYNRAELLPAVLRPVLVDPASLEVIVVDDGSTDQTSRTLAELQQSWPALRVVAQPNSGQSKAQQKGVEVARGEVVLLVDDDVFAGEGLVSGHAREHAVGRPKLVLGYMPVRLPRQRSAGEFAGYLYDEAYEHRCATYERDPAEISAISGGRNFSLRRRDAQEIGLAPQAPIPYHNEQDFGLRCQAAGLQPVFRRELRSEHLYRRSLPQFARDAYRQGAGRAMLMQIYPDQLSPTNWQPRYAWPARKAATLAARRPANRITVALLAWVCRVSGKARLWPLETFSAKLLRQIEIARAFTDRRSP